MISIKNLNIQFNRPIINKGNLEIENGKITAISGKSGSGKTSILYKVGLLDSSYEHMSYVFNGVDINLNNDHEIADYRKYKIGYVFQSNNLLMHLNIKENFEFVAGLIGKKITNIEIAEIMKLVELNIPLNANIEYLSGGERQRLAIALAYLKDPDLLILDEPTSNLDKNNAINILELLKNIAIKKHKMILITTHSSLALEYCDVVYKIEDCKIVPDSIHIVSKEDHKPIFPKVNFSFYFEYIFKYIKHYKSIYIILILIASLGINIVVFSRNYLNTYQRLQKGIFNQNANLEVFVVNKLKESEASYNSFMPDFSKEEIASFSSIEHVNMFNYGELTLDHIKIDNQVIEGRFVVQPDFRNLKLSGANLDYDLKEYNGTNIQFEYNNQKVDLAINEIISPLEANNYSHNSGMLIKVPYIVFEELNALSKNSFVFMCDSLENMELVIDSIKEIAPDVGLKYNKLQLKTFTSTISLMNSTWLSISVSTMIVVLGILLFIYKKIISNRIYEISLLKASGFSSKNVFTLLTNEAVVLSLFIALVSLPIICLLQVACLIIFKMIADINIVNYLLSTVICAFIIISASVYCMSFTLIKKSPSQMIREIESTI